jgi:uncharacterized protein YfaQ (DUF2300 family)
VDLNAMRLWGIGASGTVIAVALMLALQPAPPAQAAPQNAFEVAQAQADPVAFLVRFRGNGPIASAQARAVRGQTEEAQRAIEVQLRRQNSFAGLCFDRFTLGASEVVLRTCDAIAASERAAVQARWLQRLQAMRAVAFADANTTASQGRAG